MFFWSDNLLLDLRPPYKPSRGVSRLDSSTFHSVLSLFSVIEHSIVRPLTTTVDPESGRTRGNSSTYGILTG